MLEYKIKDVVLDDLKKLKIYELGPYSRDRENHNILNFCYDNKFIRDFDLDSILEELVLKEAKRGYSILAHNSHLFQKFPDHLDYPECFAYAIEKEIFTKPQIKKIKFDHEETPESFVKTYSREDLLGYLRKELLHPKPIPHINSDQGHCIESH